MLSESEEFAPPNDLRLTVQSKKINYTDLPAQFELLYTNTFDFEIPAKNHKFIKRKSEMFLFPS